MSRTAERRGGPYAVVSLHAHPDDEALLTAGTLARAAAEGHRVVLVCATGGEAGLVSTEVAAAGDLADRRRAELIAAAGAIGCRDVRFLGYRDSGLTPNSSDAPSPGDGRTPDPSDTPNPSDAPGRHRAFAAAPVEEAAARLAAVLEETGADVLTIYDPAGGYGHPDHVQVHRVGVRAAELAGTRVVLEATVDRRPLLRLLRVLEATRVTRALGVNGSEWRAERFRHAFADPDRITHRVDVRRFAAAKRAAMAAHRSQSTGDATVRTLAVFVRLPSLIFRVVFGHEWFVERERRPAGHPLDDIFDTLGRDP